MKIQNNLSINISDKVNHLNIKIINTEDAVQQYKTEWDKLVDISNSTIYQKSYWLFSWWKYYNNPVTDRMLILLFFDEDNLVGIAPLFIHYEKFFGKIFYRRLHFLGSDTLYGKTFGLINDNNPSDYLDIICYPEYEIRIVECFVNFLIKNHNLYDEIILTNLNDKSTTYRYLPEILKKNELKFTLRRGEICPYINTPSSFEDFLNSRTPSVKRRFTQSWKESGKLFKIKKSSSFDELKEFLNQIKNLHQQKWNKAGYPGFFGDLRYEKFFYEFLNLCYQNDVIWCSIAYNSDKTIAGRLAFKYKGIFYDYLSGIDDTVPEAKRRPGLVLLMEMIKDAINENFPVVDLLRGNESYKKDFTDLFYTNWNLRIYNKHVNLRYAFVIILLTVKFLQVLMIREILLIRIWIKEYKIPTSIFRYTSNRIRSLIRKIKSLIINKNHKK